MTSPARWPRWRGLALAAALVATAAFTLSACSPLKAINALVPDDTHVFTPAVAYGADARQRLDVYQPTSAPPPGGHPVVVFFYGGSWNKGERADYRFLGEALAARGIVAMVADYRLYPQVSYPDFLPDCAKAVAYALKEAQRYGGNPARVVVFGHSAGGYNAAMVALDARWLAGEGRSPSELAGWVGLAGPYDFLPIEAPDVKPVFHHPNTPPESQPLRHASALAPRTFIGVANKDAQVDPDRNGARLAQKLEAAGVPVTFRRYDRVNHVTIIGAFAGPLRRLAPVMDDVVEFVKGVPEVGPARQVKPG